MMAALRIAVLGALLWSLGALAHALLPAQASLSQLHQSGLVEVARLQRALAALPPARRADRDVITVYRALNARITASLPRVFHRLPESVFEVAPAPAGATSNVYTPPDGDGARPAVLWVAATQDDIDAAAALLLHAYASARGEGWAVYAESLGKELGLYDDPAAQAGALRQALLRAARVVVDTGMRAEGWTRTRAIAYLQHTAGLDAQRAAAEVDRCLAAPGQALAGPTGALHIAAMRERAQDRLGKRFSLPAFHDAMLAHRVDMYVDKASAND